MDISDSMKNAALIVIGFGVMSEAVWYLYKKCTHKPKKKVKPLNFDKKPIAEIMIFSEQSALCRTHANNTHPCALPHCPVKNLNKLLAYLSSTRKSLEICVYFLTYNAVVKLLKDLHQKRDVEIRIITDDESAENDSSQVFALRKAGIRLRTRKSLYLMHHKFAIIDNKVLITGSANWTLQAFFGNCENMLITNQSEFLTSFSKEFERLWEKYDIDYETEIKLIEKLNQEKNEKKLERQSRKRDFGI